MAAKKTHHYGVVVLTPDRIRDRERHKRKRAGGVWSEGRKWKTSRLGKIIGSWSKRASISITSGKVHGGELAVLAGDGKGLRGVFVKGVASVARATVLSRASVALNVWQPQVVHGRQKQLVQQCTVPVDSRLSALHMELKVCKQQIATYKNAYNKEKLKLNEYEEALRRVKYHPMQNSSDTSASGNEPQAKRKRLNRQLLRVDASYFQSRIVRPWCLPVTKLWAVDYSIYRRRTTGPIGFLQLTVGF
ncbi:hypothetical protein TRIUR3_05272 [Triticum urartu]|uniref:Uncharacterized protein n=1 Tax=Triticum urartu TaxID=4572 RepID=M8A7E6_TRIUA|nr:hypothetical protein TRIUR3_05272 [Triticum urartu]